MVVDDLTRGDLEQLLEDHTEKFVGEVLRMEKKMEQGFEQASDERAEIRTTLDRLDRRTNDDVTMAYKEIEKLKSRVQVLEHATQ